jgi:hypothetical protein
VDYPWLPPWYLCLHQAEIKAAERLPSLLREITFHQLDLREGLMAVWLGNTVTSRLQSTGRQRLRPRLKDPVAPPPTPLPRYVPYDLGRNVIGP